MSVGAGARLESVSRRFGSRVALAGASFELVPGEVLGLLGPNGAGKSTTMRVITGYLRPTSGRVTVAGTDIEQDPVRARRMVGYLPEAAPLPSEPTVRAFLTYCARLRAVPRPARAAEIQRVSTLAGLDDVQSRQVGLLSRGFRQRVGLAQALIGDPPVLVLDEPTVGLDPRQVAATRELIARLARRHAVLLSSHLLSEVTQLCRRVVVLDHGRVIANAAVSDLTHPTGERRVLLRLTGPIERAAAALRPLVGVDRVDRKGDEVVVRGRGDDLAARVSSAVVTAGLGLVELRSESASLEEAYLKLVSG